MERGFKLSVNSGMKYKVNIFRCSWEINGKDADSPFWQRLACQGPFPNHPTVAEVDFYPRLRAALQADNDKEVRDIMGDWVAK